MELSFLGGIFILRNFRPLELSFLGTFVTWNLHSQELTSPGTFVPNSKISMERSFPDTDNYLRQGGFLPEFVCLSVSKITRNVMDRSFRNFQRMSGMAKTTSDSILVVIQKDSCILDHFEIFVNIASNRA